MGFEGTKAVLARLVWVGLLAACGKTAASGGGEAPDASQDDAGGQSSRGGFTQGGTTGQGGFTQGGQGGSNQAGTAGQGGFSQGGMSGRGGAGASSGGAAGGGTAGASGSSGAGGVAGAGTAGSAGTCEDPGETTAPQAEAFCATRTAATLPCEDGTFDQCMTDMPSIVRQLTIDCCGDEFAAFVTCYIANGARCGTLGDVLASPVCGEVEEILQVCLGAGDNCSESYTFDSAEIECDQYAATCGFATSGPRDCTCTFGPHVGQTFSLGPPYDLVAAAVMYCK